MGSWKGTGQSEAFCLGREVSPKRVMLQAEVQGRGTFVYLSNLEESSHG